jgi:hypothetical protein
MSATSGGDEDSSFETAITAVLRLPPGHPTRALGAAQLVEALIQRSTDPSIALHRHLGPLLAAAELDPPAGEEWRRTSRTARVLALQHAVPECPLADLDQVATDLSVLEAECAGDPRVAMLLSSTRLALTIRQAVEYDNESEMMRLPGVVAAFLATIQAALPESATGAQLRQLAESFGAFITATRRGDRTAARHHVESLREVFDELPSHHAARASLEEMLSRWDLFDGGSSSGTDELPVTADPSGELALGHRLLADGTETDPARIEQAIALFRRAVGGIPPKDNRYIFALWGLAFALYRHNEVTARKASLTEARTLLEKASSLLSGPQHPQWTPVHQLLNAVHQRGGTGSEMRDSARASQRGHVWRVLLEARRAGAHASVRDAAGMAVDNARQAIATGGGAGEALWTLDSGRGLMLFAATELHRIPTRLEAAGSPDLARRWEQEKPPSDELRRRVVGTLSTRSADSLFDPPTLRDTQAALRSLDADALVYLVPGSPPQGGLAIMAPATGQPALMVLQHLDLDPGTDIERYLSALPTRDAVDRHRPPEDSAEFADRVDALCRWAWRAAIGPLLESYIPRIATRSADGVPRIVLIPMGDLAQVPWHAARRKDGTYAVQLAAFSQAVSARLLCENAALPPVRVSSTGLVVGDPDTGGRAKPLASARREAHAVRQAFYLGARYVGRLPDGAPSPSGAGTADDVRDWLRSRRPSAGAMLHLACHGFFASAQDAGARLLLAGQDGDGSHQELGFEELVDRLAGEPDRAIALVVLAACHSGRSVYGYDEAYSLGTGFLAGGTRSVLSTLWAVPDASTSALMFLFHHYLRREGLPVWQALRRAQMWMLDPHREPPRDMPAALVPRPGDDPADVLSWAGFIHYGQ